MDRRDYMDSERWWDQISPDRRRMTLRFGVHDWDVVEHISKAINLSMNEELEWYDIGWVVCSGCDGRGQYVNPSIDSHGLTREDFDEDPEFKEDYISGVYNIPCELCKGRAVIPGFVEFEPEYELLLKARDKFLDDMHAWVAESYMERMSGA